MTSPVISGTVVWSGDNPGIYLKDESGAWQTLAVYFRIVASPHGAGTGMVILGAPAEAAGWPAKQNLCLHTNEPLMRYLAKDFLARFASFRAMAGLTSMAYIMADSCATSGDGKTFHEETFSAAGVTASMRWDDLGTPFAADVPPAQSSTGEHRMLSVFVEAKQGTIRINGTPLGGKVIERDFLGRRMSTAFLAFSETWITPAVP